MVHFIIKNIHLGYAVNDWEIGYVAYFCGICCYWKTIANAIPKVEFWRNTMNIQSCLTCVREKAVFQVAPNKHSPARSNKVCSMPGYLSTFIRSNTVCSMLFVRIYLVIQRICKQGIFVLNRPNSLYSISGNVTVLIRSNSL